MFTDYTNSQGLADTLKGFVDAANSPAAFRRAVVRLISVFERQAWIPRALEDALKAESLGLKIIDGKVSFEGDDNDALDAIQSLLLRYSALLDPKAKEYTAEEAAAEIGISRAMFDTYASRQKLIAGRKVGTSMLYSRAEIDRFIATRKPDANRPGPKRSKARTDA